MARPRTGASKTKTFSIPYEDIEEVAEFIAHYKKIKVSYSAQLVGFMIRENQKRRDR